MTEECFGRNRPHQQNIIWEIPSPCIEEIKAESRYVGGAIYSLKSGNDAHVSNKSVQYLCQLQTSMGESSSNKELEQTLKRKRKELAKELYQEKSKEAYSQARERDTKQIRWALNSGSMRKLVNASVNPIRLLVMVIDPEDPNCILSKPEDIKRALAEYLKKLYTRKPAPDTLKPWPETPSVQETK